MWSYWMVICFSLQAKRKEKLLKRFQDQWRFRLAILNAWETVHQVTQLHQLQAQLLVSKVQNRMKMYLFHLLIIRSFYRPLPVNVWFQKILIPPYRPPGISGKLSTVCQISLKRKKISFTLFSFEVTNGLNRCRKSKRGCT